MEFGEVFRFKTPPSILVVGPFSCGKACFTESFTDLGSLRGIVCIPSSHDSLLLRSAARWIPRHDRRWCTISRGDSRVRPSQVVVCEGWITGDRWSDGRGRWRQRAAGFIHQTFSSSKYHCVVLVPRHVSTREIRQEYFQKRPPHHSLQESKRSITHENFTALSRSHLLARHDGRVLKSDRTTIRVHAPGFTTRQWWQETRV